jgi:Zn-dependent protease
LLFRFFGEFSNDPQAAILNIIGFIIALIIAISVHEFSHALSAYRLGDNTAKNQGRLTLNPKAHLDPMGTIMIVFAGFGWGRPTPVSPWNLRIGEKAGMAVVSVAGPISNVIVALITGIIFQVYMNSGADSIQVARILHTVIQLNLVLAIFNLLPIAPLDGFKIVLGLLPRDAALSFAKTERYGMMILVLIIMGDVFLNLGILGRVISPVISFLMRLVIGQ